MAKAKKMKIIGMTGENGGELRKYCDVLINVPENNTAMIQELHLPIYHVICEVLEEYFFAEKKVESEDAS
jgi:D-sedoheptulose 7-phosphate isomerase